MTDKSNDEFSGMYDSAGRNYSFVENKRGSN